MADPVLSVLFGKLVESGGKVVGAITTRARLRLSGLGTENHRVLLPKEFETKAEEFFPVFGGLTKPPASGVVLEARLFTIQNKGWKEAAEDCVAEAWLRIPEGEIPVYPFWMNRKAVPSAEFETIPARDKRELVVFLSKPEGEKLLFCTCILPEATAVPTWQLEVPITTPMSLRLVVRSKSAKQVAAEFLLTADRPGLRDMRAQRVPLRI